MNICISGFCTISFPYNNNNQKSFFSLVHYIVEPGNFVGWWVRDNGAFKVNVIPFFEVI